MLEFHKFHLSYQWDKLSWYFCIETSDNTCNTRFHLNIQHENYLEFGWELLGLWMEGNFMYILTVLPYFRQWLVLGCSTCTCSIVVLFTFNNTVFWISLVTLNYRKKWKQQVNLDLSLIALLLSMYY